MADKYTVQNEIRVAPELSFGMPALIDGSAVTADANGKKIIKAGTPVGGATNFLKDDTAKLAPFTGKSGSSSSGSSSSGSTTSSATVQGITAFDVDVTSGQGSVTVYTQGIFNLNRMDSAVQAELTDTVQAALTKMTFLKR